jgi:hypothetical protein
MTLTMVDEVFDPFLSGQRLVHTFVADILDRDDSLVVGTRYDLVDELREHQPQERTWP